MRPVSSRTRSRVVRGSRSRTSKWVTALAGTVRARGHHGAVAAVAADRGVDRAALGVRVALHERRVLAGHLARLHHPLERRMRLVRARHDEQARGVLVEAVDDAGPLGMLAAPARARLGERRPAVAGRGMRDHSGGLVHHEQVLVLVDDLEGDRLRRPRGAASAAGSSTATRSPSPCGGSSAARAPSTMTAPRSIAAGPRRATAHAPRAARNASRRSPASSAAAISSRAPVSGSPPRPRAAGTPRRRCRCRRG